MSRKKLNEPSATTETEGQATAVAEPATEATAEPTSREGQPPAKNWGPPYKSIYSCPTKGFEMGEDRQFRQRLFKFIDKPGQDVLDILKGHGFTYRANEKAWTIPATAETRLLTDRLAQEFSGVEQGISR